MKKNVQSNRKKAGFTMLAALFFVSIVTTFLSMIIFTALQHIYTVKNLASRTQAQLIAEAGCELGYSILSSDWGSRYNPAAFDFSQNDEISLSSVDSIKSSLSASSIDASSFNIGIRTIGNNTAILSSTGTCGSASIISIVSMRNIGGSNSDGNVLDGKAFEYAILCGGDFDFSGCGSITTSSGSAAFHANGNMFLRGTTDAMINLSSSSKIQINNNVAVGGNIKAPTLSYKANKVEISGDATEADVDIVEIPDIDLTPYYNWASSHNEVHEGFSTTSSYTPEGGILWVNGDVHISSHAVITGSIVATGNIKISGDAQIEPPQKGFALASRDGDISITSSGTIKGLVYAKTGNLSHTANGSIQGQLIVNGDIKKAGNSDIMTAFAENIPTPPEGNVLTDYITITSWQQ